MMIKRQHMTNTKKKPSDYAKMIVNWGCQEPRIDRSKNERWFAKRGATSDFYLKIDHILKISHF